VSSAAPKHEARVRAEVADFLSSSHAATFARPARDDVGAVAREFLDACYGDVGVRPDLLGRAPARVRKNVCRAPSRPEVAVSARPQVDAPR
jgi:hypothetical protein